MHPYAGFYRLEATHHAVCTKLGEALAQIDALRVVAAELEVRAQLAEEKAAEQQGALELCDQAAQAMAVREAHLEAQLQAAEEMAVREAEQRLAAEQGLAACQAELEEV
jgi:hypothetical protein